MSSPKIFILFCSLWGAICATSIDERDSAIWGSSRFTGNTSIRPFEVKWSDKEIEDLLFRLKHSRPPTPSLTNTFEYGFNSEAIKGWTKYWAHKYDFKAGMRRLNKFPQFMTTIQGIDMHFVWVKPNVPETCKVVPLLLLHGFPSSVVEYFDFISEITKDCVNGVAVEVIAASMPGHYYSGSPNKPGCGAIEIATIMKNLMQRLGHDQFYIHSNDCVHVDSMIATLYPDAVLGLHTANPITFNPVSWAMWLMGSVSSSIADLFASAKNQKKMYPLLEKSTRLLNDISSLHVLTSRPDTLSMAFAESPTFFLAFLLLIPSWLNRPYNSKLPDGGLTEHFDRNVLLDEFSVYWFQNNVISAGRIFAESINLRTFGTGLYSKPTPVPTWGLSPQFAFFYQSPKQLQMKYPNLLGFEICKGSGHYPAYDQTEFTAKSLYTFISKTIEWYARSDAVCQINDDN